MPKATISTYTTLSTEFGDVRVNNIISEQESVPNIQKEVNFGKYSKKLQLHTKTSQNVEELCRWFKALKRYLYGLFLCKFNNKIHSFTKFAKIFG